MVLGQVGRNTPGSTQNFPVIQCQKAFQLGHPVLHRHGNASRCLPFGKHQILFSQVVQSPQLFFRQIVFGHAYIAFANARTVPVGQPHVGLAAVRALLDQLCRRMAVDGVVHLVLHRGKKLLGDSRLRVVIHAGGIDVRNLLIEAALARADVLQPLRQLIKVITPFTGVFQALVIQHKAFDDELLQLGIGPLPKAHTSLAAHPKAQGQHHLQVVVRYLVAFAIGGSCSVKPNN